MIEKVVPAESHPFRFLRWSLTLPVVATIGAYFWIKKFFVGTPTEEDQRKVEKARQRRIRRELRGLPPEESAS